MEGVQSRMGFSGAGTLRGHVDGSTALLGCALSALLCGQDGDNNEIA